LCRRLSRVSLGSRSSSSSTGSSSGTGSSSSTGSSSGTGSSSSGNTLFSHGIGHGVGKVPQQGAGRAGGILDLGNGTRFVLKQQSTQYSGATQTKLGRE
jgi:hypothetical protein